MLGFCSSLKCHTPKGGAKREEGKTFWVLFLLFICTYYSSVGINAWQPFPHPQRWHPHLWTPFALDQLACPKYVEMHYVEVSYRRAGCSHSTSSVPLRMKADNGLPLPLPNCHFDIFILISYRNRLLPNGMYTVSLMLVWTTILVTYWSATAIGSRLMECILSV